MIPYKIIFNTCEDMSYIGKDKAKLVVTSPPYWNLKDYESDNQIGYKENYDTYLSRMMQVWEECANCLHDDGVFIININTKSENKSLKLIPNEFIKQLKTLNWILRDTLYWHKSSAIPQVNNFGDHFEYFLIFTKNPSLVTNNDQFFDYKMDHINNYNSWNINKKFGSVGKKYMIHPAVFPVRLIERLILIFSEENDLIVDPFLGSGTSLIASHNTKRRFVGYELNNEEYTRLIKDRLTEYSVDLNLVDFVDSH